VLIEGMALQKPVIAMAQNGPLEIISHNRDGLLVQPDEADGLAHAMRRVLQEKELREELGRHGRETVVQKFHIADSAARIHEIYREVLV
jgi:glycosyltransferase involved in cell wall biosynthesis